jgi:hypothetical protein
MDTNLSQEVHLWKQVHHLLEQFIEVFDPVILLPRILHRKNDSVLGMIDICLYRSHLNHVSELYTNELCEPCQLNNAADSLPQTKSEFLCQSSIYLRTDTDGSRDQMNHHSKQRKESHLRVVQDKRGRMDGP